MKILFVVPYPLGVAASQRFRVEQFFPELNQQKVKYKVAPFWDRPTWSILYKEGHKFRKTFGFLMGLAKRAFLLSKLTRYDWVFIHREATPVGPPWFEWIVSKVLKKKIIYDFDDAIWLDNTSEENKGAAKYKWHQKVADISAWSYKICVGNKYLLEYALKFNNQVYLIPSTLDSINRYNHTKEQNSDKVVIGWTGSHSTLPYLKLIESVIQKLENKYTFEFVVISDRAPDLNVRSLIFLPWNQKTEINDLLEFNIGVMPLPSTEWAQGKCAFKALQYMALGIPAVVSAVGANIEAVPDGSAGYTCTTEDQWYDNLERLLLDTDLRKKMGLKGKEWIKEKYSQHSYTQPFLQLFT